MTVLWLDHRRMLCLSDLQSCLQKAANSRENLYAELIWLTESGQLGAWLRTQPEVMGTDSREPWADEAIACLCSGPVTADGHVRRLLERILGLPEHTLPSGEAHLTDKQAQWTQKQQWVCAQPWYDEDAERRFRLITDWDMVITNQTELMKALSRVRMHRHTGGTLFLCKAPGMYRMNLRGITGLVICGWGSPDVMHTELEEDEVLDMDKQNLRCENLTLKCIGHCVLKGTGAQSADLKQVIL